MEQKVRKTYRKSSFQMNLYLSTALCTGFKPCLKFVVCPHAQYLHHARLFQHLVHQSVPDIQPPRIRPLKRAAQLLIRRRVLKRVFFQDGEKRLRLFRKMRRFQLRHIRRCRLCIDNPIAHHSTSSAGRHSSVGVFSPSTIFFCMPGTAQSSIVAIRSL